MIQLNDWEEINQSDHHTIPTWAIEDSCSVNVHLNFLVTIESEYFAFPMNLNKHMFRYTRKMTLKNLKTAAQPLSPRAYLILLKPSWGIKFVSTFTTTAYCVKIYMVLENTQQSIPYYFAQNSSKAELTKAILSQPLSLIFQKLLIQSITKFWKSSSTT